MSKLFNWAAARLVAAFALALPLAADAFPLLFAAVSGMDRNNPVTGETEIYDYNYTGSGEWTASDWQNANGEAPNYAPGTDGSGIWSPMLIDIEADISVEKLNGWELQLGVFSGARVTVGELGYWTGSESCFAAVDEDSSLTISATTGNNWNNTVKFFVANSSGITFTSAFAPANPNGTGNIHYYLKGSGSVTYSSSLGGGVGHVIKQADVTLSGSEKSVQSKTLVSFASTDKTFTADAAIKITDGDDVLKTIYLTSVTAGATTITTEADVGTCELVQTSTGIVLYYVDGDPNDVTVEEKTYKPSISINFTNGAANGLTTQADVGLSGYEVPGTSWNNYVVANSTFSTVNAVDSTGAASAMSGVSVTISGTRGSYSCSSLTPSSNPLHGYIDENASNPTPTVTVTGIPYYKYRVLVYHSTDSGSVPFGYDTINGKNYTYVNDALSEGTTAWGNSGAQDSANAIAEGSAEAGNVLVTEALSGSTLTVVGHRAGGNSSARGCIAAIQIIEVKADVGENDLEIPVTGDTQYMVEDTKELSGTVYLTGLGTLTLAGENKISAATIEISEGVTLVVNADRLDGTTFTGGGTVVYDGVVPPTGKGWTESAWTGTVWIKNKSGVTGNTEASTGVQPNSLGNSLSKVKFSGVSGWIEAPVEFNPEIILENAGYDYALRLTNGNSPNSTTPERCTVVKKLSGSGTLCCGGTSTAVPTLKVYDAAGFTGSINTVNADDATKTGLVVVFCDESTNLPDTLVNMFINSGLKRTVYVASGKTVTLDSAATWTAATGFVVEGTLNANGTLVSSHETKAVSGTGTVVFGGVPSPTGDAWWKNAAWTGTVEIKGATALNGDYAFNDYGNSASTLKLTNCSGWLKPNYTCVPALEIGGTFTWNDGSSGLNNTFKVATLKGSGTISIPNQGAATAVWQITENWSQFTGAVVGNNGAAKRILVFGSTLPTTATAGVIYVSEGATLNLDNASGAWWGVGMGFVVDGTVKASSRSKWGGGTYMTLGDTGVLELVTGSEYVHDAGTSFSNVTGTGTVRYTGSNWRSLPDGDNMFATTLSIELENDTGVVFNGGSTDGSTGTIGGLFGTKNLRTDLGGYSKVLTVKQAKDGLWGGIISDGDRLDTFIVDPGETTTGTLTLAGTHTSDNKLTVNGSVNLTGTWKGATTVAGTFGGTGTLTGDLTFSDSATLKANASALTVSGTVTLPNGDGESLTIDATGLDADEVTILSSESITTETDVSKVTVDGLYTVEAVAGALKLVSTRVEVTVPAINNATVTVSVGGETIGTEAGTYKVAPDAVVTATYAAEAGYEISGQTVYTIDVSNSETTFDPAGTTQVNQYVAMIDGGASYTTLQAAFDATAQSSSKVVLLANEAVGATVPAVNGKMFYFYAGEFTHGEIANAEGNFITTATEEQIEIGSETVAATKYRVLAAVALVVLANEQSGTYYGDYMVAYNAFLAGPVGTTMQVFGDNPFSEIPCTTYDSETQTYTKLAAVASITVGQVTSNYPSLSDAFAAAESGQTIKVLCDNTSNVRSVRVKEGATVTLDLNGCTVTGPSGDNPMFWLEDNSNFVVTDTTEDKAGKLVSEASKVVWSNNRCTLTLTAGTLESTTSVPIYIYYNQDAAQGSRTVNINGGRLVSNSDSSSALDYCVMNASGTVNMRAGEIVSACGGFGGLTVNVSGGTVTVGTDNAIFRSGSASITVTGGTFNKTFAEAYLANGYEVVNNGNGTYTVRKDMGWVYAAQGYWNYTGAWTGVTPDDDDQKVTIEDGAKYTANKASDGTLVTLDMTMSFEDINDDDGDLGDAKAAIRLGAGETEGTYVFQLYTYENSAAVWKNATGFAPTVNTDYKIVFELDLSRKTYTAGVVFGTTTNALSVGESTAIAFAYQGEATAVQTIDFVGSGTVTSIEGSYGAAPPIGFVEDQVIGDVTLTSAQAAWLNGQSNYDELAAKIADMEPTAFNNAYLLNLDITGEFGYEFKVTAIEVGDDDVTVTVSLTRTGALDETTKINGSVVLTGTDELGKTFETIDEAAVADDDFSEGNTTTITLDKGDAKFFQPVIE